jgi:pimeloyl-ACP methyl ester carboxylesterase
VRLTQARLAAWLGPWAGSRAPAGVARARVELGAGAAYVYRPRRAHAVYLVTPGLHYAGPDDPRLDRFCRVLANAGFVVVAPLLRDFLDLVITERTTRDLAVALDHACSLAEAERLVGPAVFSVSFGSRPAIELCASEAGRRATALVLFGGFCDFDATVRFAVTGRARHEGTELVVPHDPLNAPVVYLNLLPFLDRQVDKARLAAALRAMVVRTWGRPELKVGRAREGHAASIAATLDARERELFLVACGLEGDPAALLEEGLAGAARAFAWVDPRPHLAKMKPPVVIVHGRDDDVIPWTEADKLASALPPGHPHARILTGLYGHTGSALPDPRAVVDELRAMARIVSLLARAPDGLVAIGS